MSYINLIVAASNLYGVRVLFEDISFTGKFFTGFAMVASILFHLSEQKHNLPGIRWLRDHMNGLLWMDRIAALSIITYILYWAPDKIALILQSLPAFILLGISELQTNPYIFAPIHIGWHLSAFHLALVHIR